MDDPYHIGFVAGSPPSAKQLYDQCRQAGMKTTPDGQSNVVAEYSIGLTSHTDMNLENALEALEDAESGSMRFWTDSDMVLRVGISIPTTEEERMIGCVSISFQTSEIDGEVFSEETYKSRIDEIINLVEQLIPIINPEYVWSSVYNGDIRYNGFVPDGEPIIDNIDNLSWITVVSDQVIDRLGGREHVLETPAVQLEEFDSGHIMIVLEEHPLDVTELTDSPAEAHLL